MPLIELKLRKDWLDDAAVTEITTELTHAASEAEGTDLDRGRSLTWTLVDEYADEEWRVGGAPVEGPTYLVRISLAEGLANPEGKEMLVERVDEAIAAVDPDYNPMASWVVVDEVSDGHWGAGGTITSSAEIASICGAELVSD